MRKISVIGLGYVGLPVAVAFGQGAEMPVIAFDINKGRIEELKKGIDVTGEVTQENLTAANLKLTTKPTDLKAADFHIVTVPTPIDGANRPDFTPLLSASRTVGAVLKKGDIVVYESTVYPGATEDICVPVLEELSGLIFGKDFTVGYSPERINPGDQVHRFETITKVVSGSDAATLETVAQVYESVVKAGVHRAANIKTAEAAKVIENTQRDLNIALMNELALIFNRLGIDTRDVLAAAGTKWNFLPFTPGLVGGHCIGVDPYYLTHCAEKSGYHPEVILAGRHINDSIGAFVASEIIKKLLSAGASGPLIVSILGFTFKEDVPDFRNTKVIDIIDELKAFGVTVQVHDPLADTAEVRHEYGIELMTEEAMQPAHAIVLAVSHEAYVKAGWQGIRKHLKDGKGLVADIKGGLDRSARPPTVDLWRL